ncbi:hypothetical protein PIB30_054641 [Stylosanthes scabra]|uniref:Uncharacterized protein n=1 Tax=Stylosanthes scabra TaxID=79078 RepID=A0ABU6WIP6_9FABA|nr:hypothetical protein [Stylosanthes scabra]
MTQARAKPDSNLSGLSHFRDTAVAAARRRFGRKAVGSGGETTDDGDERRRRMRGAFISASKDKSRILDFIEKKIAKVTMIPRSHGEAFNILRYEVRQKYDSHNDAYIQSQRVLKSNNKENKSLLKSLRHHSYTLFYHNLK